MILKNIFLLITYLCLTSTHSLFAEVKIGEMAPDFTLKDHLGQSHQLKLYKDNIVVLEWTNYDCPFVKKHYQAGNMQNLQKIYREKGIIWLSINSSAKGKQGHFDAETISKRIKKSHASPTAYLLDSDGTIGHLYGAKTTPHIFIIDKNGTLIYQGAIDADPGVWGSNPLKTRNFVRIILDAHLMERDLPLTETKPYGCSVKY
jgi:peroxiredoxin